VSGAGPGLPPGPRRQARERALSLLYEAEAKDVTPAEVLAQQVLVPEAFVTDVVAGVGERLAEIDGLLGALAVGWPVERMPAIDRNLLRLAVYELLAHPDTPAAVVLSEAVALASTYSTEDSSRFVNGVLAEAARRLR